LAVSENKTSEWTLWMVAVSCSLHVLEEYFTGWQEWAAATLGIVMSTAPFLIVNAVLVFAAFALASSGWKRPALSLVIPAATLVNAIFFHIVPTLVQHRVSPGVYTAALLYVPFSSWAFIGAWRDGVAKRALLLAFISGTTMMISVALVARGLGRMS
jgi:hypothetical protein